MVDSLEKHASTVNALALTKDGRVLLSGGCDGLIVAWERRKSGSGSDPMVLSGVAGGHDGAVLCLICLGLDGHDMFVSGSADRTVRIWGRSCGSLFCCVAVLEGHHRPVRSLAVATSDDKTDDVVSVCTGSLDGEIKIWRVMVSELIEFRPSHSTQWKPDALNN